MSEYTGHRLSGNAAVWKDGRPFSAQKSLAIRNHSPTGFEWGYSGSGPAQLALALLLEETPADEAEKLYQRYKTEVVARWGDTFSVTSEEIFAWVEHQVEQSEA